MVRSDGGDGGDGGDCDGADDGGGGGDDYGDDGGGWAKHAGEVAPPALPHNRIVQQYYPHTLVGIREVGGACGARAAVRTADGASLVATTRTGASDLAGLATALTLAQFQRHMLFVMEARLIALEALSAASGHFEFYMDVHDLHTVRGWYKTPVEILQRTFFSIEARRCTAMERIFIPAYCFAIP